MISLVRLNFCFKTNQFKMHIKSAIVSGLALVSATSAYTLNGGQRGMTQATEYATRNMGEICFSTIPVPTCQEGHVVKSHKNEKVGFHCVSRNSIEGQRWKEQVENQEVVQEMNGKSVHVQGRVQVPTKCVEQSQVSGQEQRRRKIQQQHGNRVELVEEGLQEFDQENQWEEEDQLTTEEQYDQYRKNRSYEDNQWQRMQSLFNQYPELTQKKLHQLVKADESKYEQVAEQLKELVQQKKVTSHLMPQIQTTLPVFFSDVTKQVYQAMQEQQEQHQQNPQGQQSQKLMEQPEERLEQLVGNQQQYKELMKRVYVYIVKEALKLNQQAPRRLANVPELARKVWEKLQRTELTRSQIEKIEQVQQRVEQLLDLDQTNQLIAEELVSEALRTSQKQARRNVMKVVITGLMMENHPSFQNQGSQNFEQNY